MEGKRSVPDGTVFLREGETNQEAFMILQGKVSVTRQSEQQQEILLAELSEGEVFGEMSLIDETPCSATVKAIGNVQVQVLNKENFLNTLQNDHQTMQTIMSSLFQRIRTMNTQVLNLEDQILSLAEHQQALDNNHILLKALTEPAKHALYDMPSIVVDDFPYQIGRWSKQQSKRSWFSSKKVRNHVNIHDIPPYVISRQHCRIEKKDNSFYVLDLDSRLGTWVNGENISNKPNKQTQLISGRNSLHIGAAQSEFSFEIIIP